MAAVGDRTRAQERLLQEDSMVESVVLEWNAGGHFADAGKRLAKGREMDVWSEKWLII